MQHHWPRFHIVKEISGQNSLPLVRGVELDSQHIQRVPGGDADSPEQAEQSDHGWLAVAKGQEETADARNHTGARWRRTKGRREVEGESDVQRKEGNPDMSTKNKSEPARLNCNAIRRDSACQKIVISSVQSWICPYHLALMQNVRNYLGMKLRLLNKRFFKSCTELWQQILILSLIMVVSSLGMGQLSIFSR